MSRRRPQPPTDGGFTIVELLVVVAVIGLLAALLLPAVQSAREAARRSTCQANLRQLALACLQHADVIGHLPTGGWGRVWVGDPDRGYGARQPGGWAFNILPHVEQAAVRDLGAGVTDVALKQDLAVKRLQTPQPLFVCPSRRGAGLARYAKPERLIVTAVPTTTDYAPSPPFVARGDYAANMGSGSLPDNNYRGGGSPGPATAADALSDAEWTTQFGPPTDGLIYRRSRTRLRDVIDGLSSTYLLGEKFVDPATLATGLSDDDDNSLYSGHDRDVVRTGVVPPYQDQAGFDPRQVHGSYPTPIAFGSPHPQACGMAMADGSVRSVGYAIDQATHRRLASRNDGTPTRAP